MNMPFFCLVGGGGNKHYMEGLITLMFSHDKENNHSNHINVSLSIFFSIYRAPSPSSQIFYILIATQLFSHKFAILSSIYLSHNVKNITIQFYGSSVYS
jgi:hypothetical protein